MNSLLKKIKTTAIHFNDDDILNRAAALSYYSALAMAPLVVLLIWCISLLNLDLQTEMIQNSASLLGEDGAQLIKGIVVRANDRPDLSTLSGWLGALGLLISASMIFAQIQTTLNLIFEAEAATDGNESQWNWVKNLIFGRLLSIGMLLAFIFLAIVSMAVSSTLAYFLGAAETLMAEAVNFIVNFVVFAGLFSLIYKWMPDRTVHWRSAVFGGMITAVLFIFGKTAIGLYLGTAAVGSAYGASGSLVVMLVWVFYSSTIFFLGAEISYVFLAIDSQTKSSASTRKR